MLRCQESVEVKNPKGGWEGTFLCLLTDFDLEQMLCQKEAESPPCAGTVPRLHKGLKFQPPQLYPRERRLLNASLSSSGMFSRCPCLPRHTRSVTDRGVCVLLCWDIVPAALAPQLGSWEDHHHQNLGSQPKSLLITVFSAGTECTFLTVA